MLISDALGVVNDVIWRNSLLRNIILTARFLVVPVDSIVKVTPP